MVVDQKILGGMLMVGILISMNIMRYRFAPRSPRVLLDLYLNQESLLVCSDIQALSLITPPSSILVANM
jgi:hypothetical protein